jgi:hypothetical protein
MGQVSYRERITRYVVAYMKLRREGVIRFGGRQGVDRGRAGPAMPSPSEDSWSSDIFHDLFQRYPRHVTLRMVVNVLRDKRVFEDTTEFEKERYGRRYRFRPEVAGLETEAIVALLMNR